MACAGKPLRRVRFRGCHRGLGGAEQGVLPHVVAWQVAPCPLDATCVAGGLQAMRSVAPLGCLCSTDRNVRESASSSKGSLHKGLTDGCMAGQGTADAP